MEKKPLDVNTIRARLAGKTGRRYWRSLEEIAGTETFKEFLHREFPQGASEWHESLSRRSFLKLMGASLALAGLTGCASQPPELILPYREAPETLVPGKPLFFATAMPLGGIATGLLVENQMGRPIKVEGNPDHPASLGATDAFAQASILTLYDPDRAKTVTRFGIRIDTWSGFQQALAGELATLGQNGGAGLAILTETVTSPTMYSQLQAILAQFPSARWYQYEPVARDTARQGAQMAFGRNVETLYDLSGASVILALDADFLAAGPGHLRYARQFADRRKVRAGDEAGMNRLYVVAPHPSPTGAVADHKLPLRASQVEGFTRRLARAVGLDVAVADDAGLDGQGDWIAALARDLQANRGRSVVIAGEQQPPVVHALAHALNDALGNVGATVFYTGPVEPNPVNQTESLVELVRAMAAGEVQLLVVVEGNPVYNAPADVNFAEAMQNVPTRIYWGLYENETAYLSHWYIPATHYLETWSDVRAFDGTVSIIQPLIYPLYDGKTVHEFLAAFLGQPDATSYDLVRAYWQDQNLPGDFETAWKTALHQGVMENTGFASVSVTLQADFAGPPSPAPTADDGLELVFRPDPSIWDGRFANNGWLQELPKPLTKLTWDNAALVSPATAARLGLANQEVVELAYRGRTLQAPIWIAPGHADDSVTVYLGYGRTRAGSVGNGQGFNAYLLRTSDAPWFGLGLQLRATGSQYVLATTQQHFALDGRNIMRTATLDTFRQNPNFVQEEPAPEEGLPSLYPEYEYNGYAWGMVIDQGACVGCNACVVACQAENNIPIVGKEGVLRGREMHWLRIDAYYEGDNLDNPPLYHQPMLCQHCENAPCEVVCPVGATTHSAEGLNQMTYNRCVGTRYCSNNCPYKVRRFNFLQYTHPEIPVIQLMYNPDVTVRSRGVMEKCTYCVQRINAARIQAEKENRLIRDGEIVTACQAACPTQAIVFGNINDKASQVAQLKAQPHNYGVLAADLDTQPRTSYLGVVRNPNPEIGGEVA